MEKITNYISKKVISLNSASQVGYVLNVQFDQDVKTFTGLIVADEESENTFFLSKENIKAVGNVKKIITDKCEFTQRFIRKSGDDFIIFGCPKKNIKKNNFKENLNIKNIENMPSVQISEIPIVEENKIVLNPEMPVRLYADTKKLINKKISKDILGYNNEIICHKGQKINQKIINKAIFHNKLNLLKFYSE